MRAGKLNKKVRIQTKVAVKESDGGTRETWQNVASSVWAAIEPLRGREWHDAGGTQSEVDHRIRIRYRGGIKSGMRIVTGKGDRERIFDIQHVADIRTEGRELHLMAKEYGGTV